MGLLFDNQEEPPRSVRTPAPRSKGKNTAKISVPNPYDPDSSESDDEPEADLDEVATIRRSLARPLPQRAPTSEGAKKGWRVHHSVFPNSSPSSSSDEGEKETESDTEDERSRMMGRSRQRSRGKSQEVVDDPDDDPEGYMLPQSETFTASSVPPEADMPTDMEEPLLGPEDLDRRGVGKVTIPNRLQVYHGRFGHWEREGLRKYKGISIITLFLRSG
jgi:hypothetical protein